MPSNSSEPVGSHWSSKFGEWLLAAHPRDEIAYQDNMYRTVRIHFRLQVVVIVSSTSSALAVPASGGRSSSTTTAPRLASASSPAVSGGISGVTSTGVLMAQRPRSLRRFGLIARLMKPRPKSLVSFGSRMGPTRCWLTTLRRIF